MRDSLKGASEAEIHAAVAEFIAQDSLGLKTTRRRASKKPNTSASVDDTAFEDLGTDPVKTTEPASRAKPQLPASRNDLPVAEPRQQSSA